MSRKAGAERTPIPRRGKVAKRKRGSQHAPRNPAEREVERGELTWLRDGIIMIVDAQLAPSERSVPHLERYFLRKSEQVWNSLGLDRPAGPPVQDL